MAISIEQVIGYFPDWADRRVKVQTIAGGYTNAKSRRVFRDFVQASADVHIDEDLIRVRFRKRARNPFLVAAGFDRQPVHVPWFGHKKLELVFG